MKALLFLSALGTAGGAVVAAEEALPPWAQYGILGAVIIALVVTKQLVPGWVYQDVRTELNESRVENKTLTAQLIANQEVALPALQTSSQVLADALPLLRDAAAIRDQRSGGS